MGCWLAVGLSTDCYRKQRIDKGCVCSVSERTFSVYQNLDFISQITSPCFTWLTLCSVHFSEDGDTSHEVVPTVVEKSSDRLMSSVACNIDEWSEFEMSAFQPPAFP